MRLLVFILVTVVAATAKPQGYNLRPPSGSSLVPRRCADGQVLHVDGRCVSPRINRRVFLYDIPKTPTPSGPPPYIPEPTVETNLVFIRTPEGGTGPDPIIVPPPRQENVVYVLNKQSEEGQRVIEIPAPASDPEVYFVNYVEGENPTLPIGVDLETALNAASGGNGQALAHSSAFSARNEGSLGTSLDIGGGNGLGDLGRTNSVGGSNSFGSTNGFVANSGIGSTNGFGGSSAFGSTNGFGGSSGLGGSTSFGINGSGGTNGFISTSGLENNLGIINGAADGTVVELSGNTGNANSLINNAGISNSPSLLSTPSTLYRTP